MFILNMMIFFLINLGMLELSYDFRTKSQYVHFRPNFFGFFDLLI